MFRPSQDAVKSQETLANTSASAGIYHPFPESFCPDVFWNRSVTWDTTYPDFTRCFQQTALVWIPCGFLWLMLPLQGYGVLSSPYKIKQWTWASTSKMMLTCSLIILNLIDFFYVADLWRRNAVNSLADVDLTVPLIKAGTLILVALFIFLDRRAARPSSGILLIFWLLMLVEGVVTFRFAVTERVNSGLSNPPELRFITLVISFPIVIVQFVLSWFAEYFPVLVGNGKKPSQEPLASIPSWISFSYFTNLAYHGWKKPLLQSDLWDLIREDQTKTNVDRLQKFWDRELDKSKGKELYTTDSEVAFKKPYSASLGWALIRTFWAPALMAGIYRMLQDLLLFVSPQVLRLLIAFISDGNQEAWKGYFYAAVMLVAGTTQCFFVNHFFFKTSRVGLQIRGSLMAAVYRKALKITSSAKRSSNLGEIVNLMSVDAQRLNDLMVYVHLLWSAPFSIGLTIYFLYDVVGYAVFAGLAVLLMTIPSNVFLASRNKRIQLAQMKHKDARIKLTSEILNGMKVLKLYAWEESFEKQVLELRELELRQLQKAARLEALSAFNWFVTPFLMSFVTFATFVLVNPVENILDADIAFVALSLLNILRLPLTMLPHCVTLLVQSRVSLTRLTKFLCNDELNPNNVRPLPDTDVKHALRIQNGTFSWGREEPVCLKDINLDVTHGELLAVVGQVGSGKSSVVAAMLGLMEKLSGDVAVKGTVAYVPQQAWIQNLTLKENILFGKPLDEERYQKVLDACALRTDLELLAAGDETEIGEKGTNLSGGQRQRVSLARAVYSDSDVYFLDDPLSAVDAHVGKHIFEHVIGPSGMLNDKTRILVTHGVGYLPQVDRIVVLGDKHISEVGTYDQLLHNNGAFAEFLRTYYLDELEAIEKDDPEGAKIKDEILTEVSNVPSLQLPPYERQRSSSSASTISSMRTDRTASMRAERKVREVFRRASRVSNRRAENGSVLPDQKTKLLEDDDEEESKGKLMETETTESGQVKWKVFDTYFKNATYLAALGMVGSYTMFNTFNVLGSFWLTWWTEDAEEPDRRGERGWVDYRLGIYFLFGILQSLFILASYTILAYGQIMASRNLHKGMIKRVMRAPMSWFDTTPLGRVVNRFSKDVEIVDSMIPLNMEGVIYCSLSVIFTLIVICISTPLFTPVIIPLGIFYFLTQRFYIASNRQLKRLEAISRSPIYSHFQESVQGSSVILAARQSERFIVENERRVDCNNMSFFLNIVSQRWVAIRMDCVGNLITFCAALFAVLSKSLNIGDIRAEDIGMSISYSLSVTQVMNWMVRNISDLESNVVSVERIKEYSEIPNEAPWVIDNKRPPKDWPPEGRVRFDDYQTRYRPELDLVLRGVDCDIAPGEKIGIVGRTGAGKSSLTLALFRIIEAAGGAIEIDKQNIADMGLHDVRSRITILPQEPVLFSGSLRLNLDPFNKHEDQEIWSALEHSHLKNFVGTLPDGLSHLVAEGGENLSVGQRQLICLARALLRKTKILVLDEATAAIDLETDSLIQETIRDKFADCTILTIAHRINTIMDSTRVMVLDAGRVKEFASPEELLADPKSIFYSLAKSAGLAA